MTAPTPLPCPFCGWLPHVDETGVRCINADCYLDAMTSVPDISIPLDRWNQREAPIGVELTAEDVIRARDQYADTDRRWRTQKKAGRS